MRIIFFFFFLLQTFFSIGQDAIPQPKNDIEILKSFIQDLANEDIRSDVILSQYVIVENPNDELYDYLEVSLDEIRINLMSKNIEDIRYTSFHQMRRKEVHDIDLEDLDSNRVYFLHYKNRQLLAVYLEQDKIASFTLVSKGNRKAHFVLY